MENNDIHYFLYKRYNRSSKVNDLFMAILDSVMLLLQSELKNIK